MGARQPPPSPGKGDGGPNWPGDMCGDTFVGDPNDGGGGGNPDVKQLMFYWRM